MPLKRDDGSFQWSDKIIEQQEKIERNKKKRLQAHRRKYLHRPYGSLAKDKWFVLYCYPQMEGMDPNTRDTEACFIVGVFKSMELLERKGISYMKSKHPWLTDDDFDVDETYLWSY